MRATKTWLGLLAVLLAFGLVATACGNDDDDTAAQPTTTTADAAPDDDEGGGAVEGCEEAAAGAPTGQVARCEPGAPAPQPLDEHVTIKLGAATRGEYLAPILLGQAMGEFEKENLTVEIVQMPTADAFAQTATGALDAVTGAPYASFTNAVADGHNMRWVLANFMPRDGGDVDTPQSGIWARRDFFSNPQDPDIAELAGNTIANSAGKATISVYWMHEAMVAAGASLADVDLQAIPPADQFAALESKAVPAAFMLDPFWTQAAERPEDYVLLAVQPKEPNGGIVFGPNLLEKDRAAGAAFVRAYLRTINTYLDEGYKENDEVIDALAETIPVDRERLLSGPELLFTWEIPEGLMARAQEVYRLLDTQRAEVMPEDQLVDRSFYLEALGAGG